LFNATMADADGEGDILALSRTHVVVRGAPHCRARVSLDVAFEC
jgi:hypothetical protein